MIVDNDGFCFIDFRENTAMETHRGKNEPNQIKSVCLLWSTVFESETLHEISTFSLLILTRERHMKPLTGLSSCWDRIWRCVHRWESSMRGWSTETLKLKQWDFRGDANDREREEVGASVFWAPLYLRLHRRCALLSALQGEKPKALACERTCPGRLSLPWSGL